MILVSACLAGINCKYDGKNNENKYVKKLVKEGKAIPVCPEVLGGMKTPRIPCEIIKDKNGKKVINKKGKNHTEEFENGALKTLKIARAVKADTAILKSKSPSCGYGKIYDGSFSDEIIKGNGLTTSLLLKNGIDIYTEKQINEFKKIVP